MITGKIKINNGYARTGISAVQNSNLEVIMILISRYSFKFILELLSACLYSDGSVKTAHIGVVCASPQCRQ
jgi:hypothetical protein